MKMPWPISALIGCIVTAGACADEPQVPEAVAPTLAEAAPTAVEISVREVQGAVEIGREGKWSAAAVGERLTTAESIRTGTEGSALLSVGDQAEVRVHDASEVTVREISATLSKLELDRGRIHAEVTTDGFTMQVQAKGTETIAETRKGAFTIFADGAGLVAVATETGGVRLEVGGGNEGVTLSAGERATVAKGAAPEVSAIPTTVLLEVEWPGEKTTRSATVAVRGQVDVGTDVSINGAVATVAADGRFAVQVALRDGRNDIRVSATDLSGRTARRDGGVEALHRAPRVEVKSEALWE